MNIKSSAAIQNNYDEISELCKKTGEPVYLTKDGEGDLVVMDIESFSRRESMFRLRETLLRSEDDIQNGRCYTVEETANAMRQVIAEVSDARRNLL
ncbi:MAG: type II toxin-antitoxin system Phd/YefM family antitoxin [Oscillospiraceae bacterium]|jgi:PHD/YefM family antitoxin component YafN of YafNO toxin-antitoxin module|nr:type II toxin-antitoxin system Phd/YefM family antitoxin [Oscillospiraceae bacterium]